MTTKRQTAIDRKLAKIDLHPVHHKYIKGKDIKVDEDSRTISGYLSIFNVVDSDGDFIIRGAYAKSIRERGPGSSTHRKIAFLWQHDMKDPIASITVLKEDAVGLYFEAVLDIGVENADRALIQLKSGTLDQFSVGYQYVWEMMEYDDDLQAFICKEINLFEGSVVTLGANEFTFFDGMKSSDMKNAKQQLLKETEEFIKSLPAEFQYECRMTIMKNINLATAKSKKDIQGGDDGDDGTSGDPNLDFIHKCLPIHGKALDLINDHADSVDNEDLQDSMQSMTDYHTDCMNQLTNIKSDIQGGKSLSARPHKALRNGRPIEDLSAALAETSFFNV
jgi:HK97 family phage prohead protease